MANELQNTNQVTTKATVKSSLVTDLNDSYLDENQYSHARNIVKNSKDGDVGSLSNEPMNTKCYSAPYNITGIISLPDDTDFVCSGDGINSEIGIGDKKNCTYKTLSNASWWNFTTDFPVIGVAKKHSTKGIVVTFTDKNNPIRRVELNKIDKIKSSDDVRLFKKISHPTLDVKKGSIGNMPNGTYSVCMAYSIDGKIFSDIYSISNRISLHSLTGSNSLEIELGKLDRDFEKYMLIVVGNYIDPTTKGVTKVAKIVGEYSISTTKISVTDFINSDYKEVKLSTLVNRKRTWEKAGIISSNSNYLLLGDLVARSEENYQIKAMSIETEYVVEQVEADYYENDGRDVSFYRDENYDFYIHGIYTTGEETDKWHIGGRRATANDTRPISTTDVYELDKQFDDCEETETVPRWKVENTAEPLIPEETEFKCGRRILGHGKMGYHESVEVYPDNKAMFGEDAGQPIRFHRTPDEAKIPRYSIIDGKKYINILGVRFKKIPKFDNPDIIGYKITRSDRKGGNGTVVARGLMTNVRSYEDKQSNQTIMYSNYTVNDLNPDVYLSSTQTVYKRNKETNFTPLEGYYKDKFSFYSPHTSFEPRYNLGSEIKIESEEVANVTGQFDIVFNHPKLKLLNQRSFWLALAIGMAETFFEAQGLKNQITTDSNGDMSGRAGLNINATGNNSWSATDLNSYMDFDGGMIGRSTGGVKTAGQSISRGGGSVLSITGQQLTSAIEGLQSAISAIRNGNTKGIQAYIKAIKSSLQLLTNLGLTAALSTMAIMRYAQEILDLIDRFTGETDYVYQFNGHADFVRSVPVKVGNKRRRLLKPAMYIPDTVVSIDGQIYNNLMREQCVYLHLNQPIANPSVKDNSRGTISTFGIQNTPKAKVRANGSAFYATSKVVNPNQYGQIGSASPVSMHSNVLSFTDELTDSPILYGGDCIISRFYFQKKMQFFNQNLANTNYRNGVEYDYRLYRNIGYPRFWLDSTKYDYGELLTKQTINFSTFSGSTNNKHNLDCKKQNDGNVPTRIDNAYMYLSNNCAIEFFVECDYNPDFREKTEHPFYSKTNNNLNDIFRSDRLTIPEEFNISRAFSDIYTTEIFVQQQREDFDPNNPIPVEQPNSVIYSLPAFNLQKVDNWQYFLPANFFSFNDSDFGTLSSIHKLDQDRLIFLFSKSSPYISTGRDFLELESSGRKISIGDGGLFAQDPREILPTDNNYGACNSRYAFSNTHGGRIYPSENQGRIFNFTDGLDDISRNGISFWCKNYMPIQLYNHFPDYPKKENPIGGVGYLTVFDSFYETVYITKRDFVPKKGVFVDYDKVTNSFYVNGVKVNLRDSRYFNDVSWTLSYSITDKSFTSWHDWHPDWIIQTENHFMTVKGNTVWKHNESIDAFCNFYGKDYPFEIELVSSTGQQVTTVRNIEYVIEAYKYKNFGRDRYHVLNENFSHLIVHNSEQISPLYNLIKAPDNPRDRLYYPKINNVNNISWDILFEKTEQKYRINQFWDAVKNREQHSHLFPTDESGYKRVINPVAIDINKPEKERKKFRHYFNKFLFIKNKSNDTKFIFKVFNFKKLISFS